MYTIIYKMYHVNCKYMHTKEIINISLFNVQRNYFNFVFLRYFYFKSFLFVPTPGWPCARAALNNIICLSFSNYSMIILAIIAMITTLYSWKHNNRRDCKML